MIEVNEGNRLGRSGDEGDVAVGAFAVGFPLFRECFWIEFSGVDKEAMTDGFRLAFWDLPVSENGAARSDSELPIDAPRLGEVGVFWMIKDGDVAPVIAALDVPSAWLFFWRAELTTSPFVLPRCQGMRRKSPPYLYLPMVTSDLPVPSQVRSRTCSRFEEVMVQVWVWVRTV